MVCLLSIAIARRQQLTAVEIPCVVPLLQTNMDLISVDQQHRIITLIRIRKLFAPVLM